ncbi:DUF1398 domain-containing protein [Candidatus Dependentiae bacterium]|nr:MAG: DUF1398 domain-containing protein [Candidatus Dependentiae bacterium]
MSKEFIIKNILKEATINKYPYPKTFELLKSNGLLKYHIHFANYYKAVFELDSSTFVENTLEGYVPVKASELFNNAGIQNAIHKHIVEHTDYIDFLHDIAANGATHYKVDIAKRTVTYFNDAEDQHHTEHVPTV